MTTFSNPTALSRSIIWTPLPGWTSIEVNDDGRITLVQHSETGFKIDPSLLLFLYGRLSANLGVMISISATNKMFLPTVAVDHNHVFAGNRQNTFNDLTPEKNQVIDGVATIIKTKSNDLNANSIPKLAQSVVSLVGQERTGDLTALVALIQQSDDADFQAKMVEYLDTLDAQDSVKAPLVSALLLFEISGMTNANKLKILLQVKSKLSRRSLIQFATNLAIRLPVSSSALNRYAIKDQEAIELKPTNTLTVDDLVILGSQISTGDAVHKFLELPPQQVFCATGDNMNLYFKKAQGELTEKIAGPLNDLKLSLVDGETIKKLVAIPKAPATAPATVEVRRTIEPDVF
jgi:hypothetical protein